jgi:small subunit ribosomal protein S5
MNTEEAKVNNDVKEEVAPAAPAVVAAAAAPVAAKAAFVPAKTFPAGARKPFGSRPGGDSRGPRRSYDKPKSEFDQKILAIRRVTRVVSGGRRMSFAIAMLIGDKKGSVGVGTGKAGDTALAINKAVKSARKNMIKIRTTKNMSIPHAVDAKYSSARLMLMPNKAKGIIAGSAVRDILILGGLKDVTSKILSGSKNKLNIARAVIKALGELKTPREKEAKKEIKK